MLNGNKIKNSFPEEISFFAIQLIEDIKKGENEGSALMKNTKTYGRFNDGVKFIDPRKE